MMIHYGFGGISMYVWMLIQWGLLLLGIYLIIRWVTKGKVDTTSNDQALSILRERYAKGEITEEQYERMLQQLREERP